MNNINHYPNIIYNIDTALIYLSKYQIQSITSSSHHYFKNEIDIDGHVVLILLRNYRHLVHFGIR